MEYIYEKDLFGMKYRILTAPMHEKVISKIAECLDMNIQELRMSLIEKLDMAFLENIPARYNSWRTACTKNAGNEDSLSSKLCLELFTDYIPVMTKEEAEEIKSSVLKLEESGVAADEAVKKGKGMVREVFLKWA